MTAIVMQGRAGGIGLLAGASLLTTRPPVKFAAVTVEGFVMNNSSRGAASSPREPIRRRSIAWLVIVIGVLCNRLRAARLFLKRNLLFRRLAILRRLSDPQGLPDKQKIAIAIAHIVSEEEASDRRVGARKLERLVATIDGLLNSFAAHDLRVAVCTMSGRSVAECLPAYQRGYVDVRYFDDEDPMHVGFRMHDVLMESLDSADWFLFIEDDIVLSDAFFIDKMRAFVGAACDVDSILMPHRYEYVGGRKCYIDLTIMDQLDWLKTAKVEIGSWCFAECSNPHGGLFMLNREQMQRWRSLGRNWTDQTLMAGPLETAATYCLMEHFRIYKPVPSNIGFLEVHHYDSKYSWPEEEMPEPGRQFAWRPGCF